LPDGSKSLIPAEWTDLSPAPNLAVHNHSAMLASLDELLRMRTVVDALLRRLAPATSGAAEPTTEESNRATTTQLSGQPSAGDIRLGTPRSGTAKHLDPSPCTSDRQGSLNQGAKQ
jgi:hypothetical protein